MALNKREDCMFKYKMGSTIKISISGEVGEIVGRVEYPTSKSYLIRYKASDGRAVESWWDETAIIGVKNK